MHLNGVGMVIVLLGFLVVLIVAGGGAQRMWPDLRRRHEEYPIVDETTPEELPDDSAPSRSDD
jgi:hypothetical protein